ncbi:uncharacterized protein LOC110892871 [Helianthus annuus]|uniref:uncharacterized protein LOC110892871 n=1 Tax=Helianthus annuus TaxID=4232 RepID=UPI000B903B02|nr:uncharacterized protein LOC110892871 [Helianthus annuus]
MTPSVGRSNMPEAWWIRRCYLLDLLQRMSLADCRPLSTPVSSGRQLSRHTGDPLSDPTMYRSTVGALQYLVLTRPEISYAVSKVPQFLQTPTDRHWVAVKRICGILRVPFLMGCVYVGLLVLIYMLIVMLTGLGVLMIDVLPQVIVFFLGPTSSVGVPRNNIQLLGRVLRLSIELLLIQLLSYDGLHLYYMSYKSR